MATLLRRLAGPMCSSRRWLGVILRETHGRTSHRIPLNGSRLLPGGGRPLTVYSRRQHTAAGPVTLEVDIKRLEREDNGNGHCTLFEFTPTNSPFCKDTHSVFDRHLFIHPSEATVKPVGYLLHAKLHKYYTLLTC